MNQMYLQEHEQIRSQTTGVAKVKYRAKYRAYRCKTHKELDNFTRKQTQPKTYIKHTRLGGNEGWEGPGGTG